MIIRSIYALFAIIMFIVADCNAQNEKDLHYLGYTRYGVGGYTMCDIPFEIFSTPNDADIIRTIDCDPDMEAGYMGTILCKKGEFFRVSFNFDYTASLNDTVWIRKGVLWLNIRGLESYDNANVIPIYKKNHLKSRIIGFVTTPQHVQILDEDNHWVYTNVIDSSKQTIKGWLAPIYQCGNPYSTCP